MSPSIALANPDSFVTARAKLDSDPRSRFDPQIANGPLSPDCRESEIGAKRRSGRLPVSSRQGQTNRLPSSFRIPGSRRNLNLPRRSPLQKPERARGGCRQFQFIPVLDGIISLLPIWASTRTLFFGFGFGFASRALAGRIHNLCPLRPWPALLQSEMPFRSAAAAAT